MEAMNVEQRLERLEKLAGITGPAICPDPTGEGSAWQGEAVRSVPVGWVRGSGQGGRRKTTKGWASAEESKSILYGQSIIPDPSIPWGEEYEAILPEEAREGDEFRDDYRDRHWVVCKDKGVFNDRFLSSVPWRRRKSPAEPAPGSDAEHPPMGYVLVDDDAPICASWLCWVYGKGPWESVIPTSIGWIPSHRAALYPLARPIPANEGDSQKADRVVVPDLVPDGMSTAAFADGYRFAASRAHSVPASRVLKDGEVAIQESERNVLLVLERYARKHGPESIQYAIDTLDALRALSGPATP